MNIGKPGTALMLTLVVIATGACAAGGGGTTPTSTSATSATGTVTSAGPGSGTGTPAAAAITIRDFAYESPVSVPPGATVTVTNMDTAGHTVTADGGGAFDVDIKGSRGTATFTAPSAPGTYPYHCTYHPNMHGTLTVK